jgi:hypothetical protein
LRGKPKLPADDSQSQRSDAPSVVFQTWHKFSIFILSIFLILFSYISLISSLSLFPSSFFLLYPLRNPQIL